MERPELRRRAAQRYGLTLGDELGSGVHGIVFAAKSQGEPGRYAVKVHERQTDCGRERDVYLRLREYDLIELRGCSIPELIAYDDQLLILAITVVSRPFVLDFAGAYLDQAPDFSPEVLADWHAEKREQFEGRWPEVQAILAALEEYGIFMIDVNPGNISFAL
jgi:hypothetical protein